MQQNISLETLQAFIDDRFKDLYKLLNPAPRFLDSKSAAAYLGISLSTLDKYCCQRRIPFQKPNRMRRFLKEDLDHFLHSNRIRSDEEIDDAADRYMAKR